MKKIDIHTHSNEISKCAVFDIIEIINLRKKSGLDGMVITNHCHIWNYDSLGIKEFNMLHFETFKKGLIYANKIGFKLFLGIEVTINDPTMFHILILGTDKEFYENAPKFPEMTLKELYSYAKKYGCFVVQAHPYRDGCVPANPNYLDGFEVNCKPSDLLHKDKVYRFAKENDLKVVYGTDFHGSEYRPCAGIYLPDDIKSNKELRDYLNNTEKIECFLFD